MDPMEPRRHSNNRPTAMHGILPRVVGVVLIVAAICGIAWFGNKVIASLSSNATVNSKEFQAVFLTNGQVYFGKLSKVNSGYLKLTNIYYLQVSNNGSQGTVQPSNSSSSNQQVSLAKLGSELHGPEDQMYIARSQVLFYENLKSSGKVVQAINNYQNGNK